MLSYPPKLTAKENIFKEPVIIFDSLNPPLCSKLKQLEWPHDCFWLTANPGWSGKPLKMFTNKSNKKRSMVAQERRVGNQGVLN